MPLILWSVFIFWVEEKRKLTNRNLTKWQALLRLIQECGWIRDAQYTGTERVT
jgi:hypothetical protein